MNKLIRNIKKKTLLRKKMLIIPGSSNSLKNKTKKSENETFKNT